MNSLFADIAVYRRSRSLLIIALASFLIIFGIPIYFVLLDDTLPESWKIIFEGAFEFPSVYNTISVIQYYLNFMVCILMINIISSRLENQTFKVALINGVSKWKIFLNTILLTVLMSTILFVSSMVSSIWIGLYEDPTGFMLQGIHWNFIYWYQSFVLLSFAVTFSLIFKHAGTASFSFFLWFFILERTLAQVLDFNFKLYPVFRFLPGKCLEDISYLIVTRGMVVQHLEYYQYFLPASCIWLILSLMVNYIIIMKQDYVK